MKTRMILLIHERSGTRPCWVEYEDTVTEKPRFDISSIQDASTYENKEVYYNIPMAEKANDLQRLLAQLTEPKQEEFGLGDSLKKKPKKKK